MGLFIISITISSHKYEMKQMNNSQKSNIMAMMIQEQ
jgi:hypothetical protein